MPRSLKEYQRKRDFSRTPEPAGTQVPSGNQRFVVQKHWATRLHYDFRLEMEGVLISWAIPKGPTLNPAERRLAAHVEDHPSDYYDFEGLIPKGEYGGGTVMVWDWGTYELEEVSAAESMRRGEVKFRLHGERLRGRYTLVRTRSQKDWLLIKKRDEAADPSFDINGFTTSVKTGRTREEIEQGKDAVWSSRREQGGGLIDLAEAEKGSMPATLEPMKASLVDEAFDDDRWLFEVKWDGIRLISFVRDGKASFQTRRGRAVDLEYPELKLLPDLLTAREAILDGEIVAMDAQGRPSFQLLQNRANQAVRLQYVVFDVVYADGQRLFKVPLEDRKRLLQDMLRPSALVRYSEHVIGQGKAFYSAARSNQLEGIVAKLRQSPYLPGVRSSSWLKIKAVKQQEVVIGGFTAPRNSRKHFGALLVGVYDDGKLVYTGHTGGGFDERTLAQVARRLEPLRIKESPFSGTPPRTNEKPTWTKPQLVAEVKFAEWTKDGVMRMPVFLGMRDDVDPRSVSRERAKDADRSREEALKASSGRRRSERDAPPRGRETSEVSALSRAAARIGKGSRIRGASQDELAALDRLGEKGDWQVAGRTVHLTNLDKVLFPEDRLTKRDLVRYYVEIAPVLIPHYRNRPLSMNPHPDGIHGKSFWQKDKPAYAPDWIPTFRYRDQKNEKDWILAVIDLDPAEGARFEEVVELARVVKSALDHLELKAVLKTTGQSGLHIYIPIERRYTHEQSRGFVEALARTIARLMPERVTEDWQVSRRTGKIRIDYTQNVINKTLAGPYSARPVPGAPVSAPIGWAELDDPELRPNRWTIRSIGERLQEVGDLFEEALRLHQRLPRL